jgi:hypothetical protein
MRRKSEILRDLGMSIPTWTEVAQHSFAPPPEQQTIREFDTVYSRALDTAARDYNRVCLRELFKLYGGGSVVEQVSGAIDAADETGMDGWNEAIY